MRLILIAFLSLAVALPVSAFADKAGPGTLAVKTANEAIAVALKTKVTPGSKDEKDLAAKVTANVRGFLDIEELGKRAMVDQWGKLTKDQQTLFVTVLRELIEASYVKGLRANVDYAVEYVGETTDKDNNIQVTTKIKAMRKGKPMTVEVDYVLVKQGDKLRAWDVKTDGVGLVENYRTMFNKVIEKDKFEGLIKRMQDKKAKTSS